jgi:hypothetical protein
VYVVGEDDPGVDVKRCAGAHSANRIAQRVNIRHQQVRVPVKQVYGKKERPALEPDWATTRHEGSMPSGWGGAECAARLGEKLQPWRAAGYTICGMTNPSSKIGHSREQASLLPRCLEDYVGPDNAVRTIDA